MHKQTLEELINQPTEKQEVVLNYWKNYLKINGKPPTLGVAKKDLGFNAATTIRHYCEELVSKGLMEQRQKPGYPAGWMEYVVVEKK
jgi:hypothetical protein